MNRFPIKSLAAACVLALAGTASAQAPRVVTPGELAFAPRIIQPRGAPTEGHCILKVWVDDRATVMMRGNRVAIRTDSGRPARDEGSFCSGPLPDRVDNFRVESSNQPAGRIVNLVAPEPRNDFTGSVTIDDPRDGGRLYVLDVWWNDRDPRSQRFATAPSYVPEDRFDEEKACQERVRNEFLARNRGDIEVEFRPQVRKQDLGSGRERIRGGGWASARNDSARFGYECVVDERRNRVISAAYELRERGDTDFR